MIKKHFQRKRPDGQTRQSDYAEKYPERSFVYVDSQCVSNGLGTYLQYLAEYDGDFIEEYGQELGKHIVHLFTESNLNCSMKSGRYNLVERVVGLMASLAHINPWMYSPSNDKLCTGAKIFRGDKILHEWAQYYIDHVADDNRFVRIGYGGEKARKRAEKFISLLEAKASVTRDQVQLAHVSPHRGSPHRRYDSVVLL